MIVRKFALLSAVAGAAYAMLVRPRLLRWGATDEEVSRPYPGADLIPDSTRGATNAITINAPPATVWPWLVQMGYGRGGWYSWDHLDNWGDVSADRIHPEWQEIAIGDHVPSMPGEKAWWEVAALEPERFLGLRATVDLRMRPFDPRGPRPRFYSDSLWGFQLVGLPDGRTRLVESGYWAVRPRWLRAIVSFVFLEPSHWIMQTRQFANLKRRAERDAARAMEHPSTVPKAGVEST
jgi:proline iminopeptidase